MTVRELFNTVLSLMFCPVSDGGEYEEMFINILNQRIRELKSLNHSLREYKGKAARDIGSVSAFTDELELEDELLAALPYGVAAIILTDEDTTGMANVYRSDYAAMLADCARTFPDEEEEA